MAMSDADSEDRAEAARDEHNNSELVVGLEAKVYERSLIIDSQVTQIERMVAGREALVAQIKDLRMELARMQNAVFTEASPVTSCALVERLAAIEHERWSGWMRYLFSKCDGAVIPDWAIERWTRQMSMPYAALTEAEKESDRVEVRKTLAAMEPAGRSALSVYEGAIEAYADSGSPAAYAAFDDARDAYRRACGRAVSAREAAEARARLVGLNP